MTTNQAALKRAETGSGLALVTPNTALNGSASDGEEQSAAFRFEEMERREVVSRKRALVEAAADLLVLKSRLGIERPLEKPLEDLLLRYCVEVTLNIGWYERKRRELEGKMAAERWGIVAVAILAGAATMWLLVGFDRAPGASAQVVTAQIGAIVSAVFYALRTISGVSDRRAQFGAFHKALAELKESLYTFEQTWREKVFGDDGKTRAEFEVAIWQGLCDARKTVRAEREAYFATFRSSAELLATAGTGLDELRTRATSVATARKEDADAAGRSMADAQQKLREARADVSADEETLRSLEQQGTGTPELTAAKVKLATAHGEVARRAALLRSLANKEISSQQ